MVIFIKWDQLGGWFSLIMGPQVIRKKLFIKQKGYVMFCQEFL
jgi:hypothetical protein